MPSFLAKPLNLELVFPSLESRHVSAFLAFHNSITSDDTPRYVSPRSNLWTPMLSSDIFRNDPSD